ncbi:MAG: deoxyribonuclease IV [Pseudomonadota bacterium]
MTAAPEIVYRGTVGGPANPVLLLGAHLSISEGLGEALYKAKIYGCTALQMFTKNAATWKEKELTQAVINGFEKAKAETGLTRIASHAAYLINVASTEKKKRRMSINALKQEMIRSSMLQIPYVILHPGSHMGAGEREGIRKITEGINEILGTISGLIPRLLLETTAGQGSGLGHAFEQLAEIMAGVKNKERIGVCLDTCHIFAAGYDIRTRDAYERTVETFSTTIGLGRLHVIHLNDAKKGLGCRVDRHEHIGEGLIGLDAFEFIMNDPRFSMVPKIIETPKITGAIDYDQINLDRLRNLVHS